MALRLPATLVFDYPTVEAMAEYLETALPNGHRSEAAATTSVLADLERLEATLGSAGADPVTGIIGDERVRAGIAARLHALLSQVTASPSQTPSTQAEPEDIDLATDAEMFDLLGREFGIS